jgi:aryl-alcohol dehydrogenase-like predicted oxidoreductase
MKIPKKRVLGRTGFKVSELGFGAWPIGGTAYGPVNEGEAIGCVESYLDGGGNFIDTARSYGNSEAILGKALQNIDSRDQIFISTKTVKGDSIETIPDIALDLEESLRLLYTDFVDIYYLHRPPADPEAMNRALDVLEEFKYAGKIRAIGASIKGPAVTAATVDLCKQYIDSGRVDVIQIVYSILRQLNAQIFAYAHENGVGIVARSAIESGFLSGKYRPGDEISDGHRRRWRVDTQKQIFENVVALETYARRDPYTSLAQVAIRFALEPKEVSTVIIGAKSAKQMRKNLEAASLPALDGHILERLKRDFAKTTEVYNPTMDKW